MPIIRRNYCINATLVFVSLYGWRLVCWLEFYSNQQTRRQSDKYQCPIDTVISPDDGHMVARNMKRREINILSRIVHLVGFICNIVQGRLRWSRDSVLAFATQVRRFKPGRNRRIFKGEKIFSTPSFGGEVKPSVPCRTFASCKRCIELHGSRILGQICRNISRPRRVPPSAAGGLSRLWT